MLKPSVVLMGSKPGSVVALKIMLQQKWDIKYVVVPQQPQVDWIEGPTLEEYARAQGCQVTTQAALPRDIHPDFVISYMFRHRVKPDVLALATRAALNFHAGPLPEFGGWAFYNIAILENSPYYGCTCHYMDESFDTGPLLKVNTFPINPNEETAVSLERKAQQEMIRLFQEFCKLVESGKPLPKQEQDRKRMRYMSQDEFKRLKQIPDDADDETIDRYARAFWYPPYESAYLIVRGQKIEVTPEIAKYQVARLLHQNDLKDLELALID